MLYRNIGGLRASVIGIGGLHFGFLADQKTTFRIIHKAFDCGVNFIDTAPMYGNAQSESFIGEAVRGRRDRVVIATKVGLEPKFAADGSFGVSVIPLSAQNIRSSLERSLRALGTDYVDLYQVHAFDWTTPLEETMSTLDELVREGKIRFIGCSNYLKGEVELTSEAAKTNGLTGFVSFQAHYNLTERRAEEEVIPACHALRIGIVCNRALSRGILTGKYETNQPLPEGSRAVISYRIRRWLSGPTLRLVTALEDFAKRQNRTVSELAVAWLLAQPDVSVVLVGVRNGVQLETNVCAAGWALSSKDLQEIDGIVDQLGLMSQVKSMPETLFET